MTDPTPTPLPAEPRAVPSSDFPKLDRIEQRNPGSVAVYVNPDHVVSVMYVSPTVSHVLLTTGMNLVVKGEASAIAAKINPA